MAAQCAVSLLDLISICRNVKIGSQPRGPNIRGPLFLSSHWCTKVHFCFSLFYICLKMLVLGH